MERTGIEPVISGLTKPRRTVIRCRRVPENRSVGRISGRANLSSRGARFSGTVRHRSEGQSLPRGRCAVAVAAVIPMTQHHPGGPTLEAEAEAEAEGSQAAGQGAAGPRPTRGTAMNL